MSPINAVKILIFPKLNRKAKCFGLATFKAGCGIPKIIHQTYFSEKIPEEIQANIAKIKEINKGWEYRFYTDNDIVRFIEQNYGAEILEYFERINPTYGAARADLFRYLVMYQCGGVYLDIKSTITAPLDDFLQANDAFILSQWKNQPGDEFEGWGLHYEVREIPGGEFQQWHIIVAAGHPFLRAVINQVLTNIDLYIPGLHGVAKNGVLRVTGPRAYTLAIAPLLQPDNHRVVSKDAAFPLKYSIYGYDAHFDVFKSHYSRQTNPVVRIGPAKRIWSKVITGLNKIQEIMLNSRRDR